VLWLVASKYRFLKVIRISRSRGEKSTARPSLGHPRLSKEEVLILSLMNRTAEMPGMYQNDDYDAAGEPILKFL